MSKVNRIPFDSVIGSKTSCHLLNQSDANPDYHDSVTCVYLFQVLIGSSCTDKFRSSPYIFYNQFNQIGYKNKAADHLTKHMLTKSHILPRRIIEIVRKQKGELKCRSWTNIITILSIPSSHTRCTRQLQKHH